MKRAITLLACAALLAACRKDIGEEGLASSEQNTVYAEEAFPGIPKEAVTLPGGLRVERAGEAYVYQGDILLTPEQAGALDAAGTRAASTTDSCRLWPRATVPYYISPSLPNPDRVTRAVEQWISATKMSFPRLSAPEGDCVRFVRGTGNSSYLGRKGGVQDIEVSDSASVGVIMHETGHTVGLFHEHSRGDRDAYIRILWPNVLPGKEGVFDKYADAGYFGRDIGTFDFGSLMMLPQNAFSAGGYTIIKADNSTYTVQRNILSGSDCQSVGFLYGPPYVKLETRMFSTELNPGLKYSESYTNEIKFYTDKELTVPYSPLNPRHILVKYECRENGTATVSRVFSVDILWPMDSYDLGYTDIAYTRPSLDAPFTVETEERYTIVGVGR